MKRIVAGIIAGGILLAGCSVNVSENDDGSTKIGLDVEKEEKVVRKASEVEATGEPIPFDEFDILRNDLDAYQNRPFEDVPVHIDNIERHSDHSIVRASGLSTTFVLLVDSNELDFEEDDHGYLSGIVADDVDMDYISFGTVIKGAFKSFEKMSEMDFSKPNHTLYEINQTKNNAGMEGTIESILVGDNFTVISYDYTLTEEYAGKDVFFHVKQNGAEINSVRYSTVNLQDQLDENQRIFVDLDVTQPFELELEIFQFGSLKDPIEPLVFEINGL